MTNNQKWFVIISGLVIVLAVLAATNSGSNVPTPTPVPTEPVITAEDTFMQGFRSTFVPSCEANGGNLSYCTCTMNYLTTKFNSYELTYYFGQYKQSGILPQPIKAAADACLSQY